MDGQNGEMDDYYDRLPNGRLKCKLCDGDYASLASFQSHRISVHAIFIQIDRKEESSNGGHFETHASFSDDQAFINSSSQLYEPENVDKFGFLIESQTISSLARVDPKTLRQREKKWRHMHENWHYFMTKNYEKVKKRCCKGIPPSLRGKSWQLLCGAYYHMNSETNKDVFDTVDSQPGEDHWVDDIKKDLSRQFPKHEMFSRKGPYGQSGQTNLFRILKAYTVLHPEEGYCQGHAPVAAVLLMHMPLRPAFYCFVQICHKYLSGYYSPGLEAVQIDGDILFHLLKSKSPVSYKHLKKRNVEPVLYMVEWFMCIYCRTLPWPTVVRIWDMFLCEGVKVLFKVGILLFRFGLGNSQQAAEYDDLHAIISRLKNLPIQLLEEHSFVSKVIELRLNDTELEKLHCQAIKRRKKLRNGTL